MPQEFHKNQCQIEMIIQNGNINELQNLVEQIQENEEKSEEINHNSCQQIPNLAISACRNNKIEILKYLLTNDGEVLYQIYAKKNHIPSPDDTDKWQHNAFYYSIRSSNIELLDTLITAWPGSVLSDNNSEMLEEILSKAYEEIRLKNILLSDEMKIFVESQLIDIHFLSDNNKISSKKEPVIDKIKERISFILEKITLLNEEFAANDYEINERFLFIAKCIAQNIFVLKNQLKSTYAILPWEEIEFCLICFISLHKTQHEINIFYHFTLSKTKLLRYLKFFAEKLHKIEMTHLQTTEIREIAKRPNLSRDEVIAKILEKCPEFIELYDDYECIRDIHSLTKMNEYIKLSKDIDSKQKEGQLVLIRTFQILGEYFKNTLESPKLSNTTSILLLFSLSNETKKIITKLRDSLAHSNSLLQRTNMERNNDVKFFIGIQNDCKKLGGLIANILHKKKMYLITMFFNELVKSNNYPDRIREMSKTLSNCFNLEDIEVDNFGNENHEKIEKLFAELRSSIVFSTNFETEMFARVYDLINFDKKKNDNSRKLYKEACFAFKKLHHVCVEDKYKIINIKEIDNVIRKLIFDITDHKEASEFKIIGLYSSIILDLCKSRMQNDEQKLSELHALINDIKFIAYSGKNCVKFIKELEQKLNQKLSPIKKDNKKNNFSLTDVKFKEDLLKQKLQELKNKLEKNVGIENITKINPCYRSNKKLQVIVELLVLDILTILCETKTCFSENNILSLIENSPLLTGRNLRNHLAHYNVLVDLFQSDPPLSIVLNANKLITENLIDNKKITGKIYQEDLAKNKKNYNWGLETVENQIAMFKTLQDGNFDDFLSCLENGSDVFARCGRMRTTLHYAAIGGCLQIVKYLYNQNVPANARDLDSKTALHFAAEYGRTDVVEYFQGKQINFMYEKTEFKEKPFYLVAQKSHKDTVEVLLGKKSNAEDVKKLNSLHLAAIIGNLNVVNYLLENRGNFKISSIDMHGKTPLHWAAQGGHLAIVKILIENKANVNSTDDDGCAPLHYAAENGHNKIFNALIKHGAKINAVDVNKFTPLHYAVKNKNEEIVNICLNSNAYADLRTSKGWTPLHYAIALGNLNIINVLLEHGVNTNCKDQKGYTPLHILSGFEFSFNKEVVQLLLNNGAVINVKDNSMCTPLHLSSMLGNIEVIESLVTNGANINALDRDNETPLHKAAFEGKFKAIEILVKNKAFVNNKNKTGLTPLYFAASNGCCDSLEYLLANKAQEDKSIWPNLTALGAAIANGHNNSVKLLLKHRSQINDRGLMDGSMLSLATNVGNFETVQILIEHGVNVNPTGMGEKSPLCEAIKLNHMKIVKLLVSKGANVNGKHGEPIYSAIFNGHVDIFEYLVNKDPSIITNSSGKNLLNIAVSRDHVEIVSALIRYGVDVNGNVNNIDINKTTSPLFLALKKDHIEIIKILVENGANINQKNIDGTPLHLAVCKNNLECVKLMIKSGMAELNAKAKDNYTILHIAAENGYLEMVKYLFENGLVHKVILKQSRLVCVVVIS